ncbi:hypothetical protein JK169_11155 [Acetobacter persici]|uniref:hypothetical protein n=1 Tax=Acetobacter persici TaxID=1076596 RepID=UPI001BA85A63|nr:hypothetical protein [Acetobacter persici]MBS1001560.1 hypothetical protein [Acetobacter persici]
MTLDDQKKIQSANDNGFERAELMGLISVMAKAVGRSVAKRQFEVWAKTLPVAANDNQQNKQQGQEP